ncbi:MAG: RcnB family protein [Sphingopyxis sp.]
MMKRILFAALVAATALTPIAASAQNGGFGERIVREARGEHRGDGEHRGGGERRGGHERRAADAQPAPAPQPHYQPQNAPQPQPRQRYERPNRPDFEPRANRGGDGGVRWNPRGDDSNAHRQRYEPRAPSAPVEQGRWQGRRHDGGNDRARYRRHDNGGGLGGDIIRDARRGGGDVARHDPRHDQGNWDRSHQGQGGRYDRHDRDGRYDRNDNGRRWDRDWRSDRRYDWHGYRNQYRDRFSLGLYYSPYRNWNYRRISIGFSLWPLFYSDRYWINDPWEYRLPDAYGPYRWVRYYDDALLVDVRTGEVVDVIDNFFW